MKTKMETRELGGIVQIVIKYDGKTIGKTYVDADSDENSMTRLAFEQHELALEFQRHEQEAKELAATFRQVVTSVVAERSVVNNAPAQPAQETPNINLAVILVPLILLIVVTGGIGAFLYFRSKQLPQAPAYSAPPNVYRDAQPPPGNPPPGAASRERAPWEQ